MNSPIQLVASIPNGIVQNQSAEFEQTSLQNPFRTAMLIDSFKFFFLLTPHADFQDFLNLAFRMWVKIDLGREPLTHNYVPVGLVSPLVQESPPLEGLNNAIAQNLPKQSFTWPLKRPLYVPPTEQLIVRAMLKDPYGGSGMTIFPYVAISGRSLARNAPVPEEVYFPWAAAFVSPDVENFGNTLFTQTTGETDLVNPFNQPVNVQRFMGRMYNSALFGPGVDQFEETPNGLSSRTLVRCADSKGTIIVRDPTPFSQLFFYGLRSWEPGGLAEPKSFYIFSVDQDYSDVQDSGSAGFGISLVGDRCVRLKS